MQADHFKCNFRQLNHTKLVCKFTTLKITHCYFVTLSNSFTLSPVCKVKAFVLPAGVLAFSWSVRDGKQEVVLADTQTVHKPHTYNFNTHKQCYLAVSLAAEDACWGPGGTAGVRKGESAIHPPWSECAACPRSLGEEGQRNPPRTHTRLPQSHCLESKTEITNQFQNWITHSLR